MTRHFLIETIYGCETACSQLVDEEEALAASYFAGDVTCMACVRELVDPAVVAVQTMQGLGLEAVI